MRVTKFTSTKIARLAVAGILLAIGALFPARTSAQVDAGYTQYWAVPAYYNAAATGNIDFIHITGGSRLQWIGIKNAPMSFNALGDMPLKLLKQRWGVGVSVSTESLGLYRSTMGGAQLAWKKKMLKGMFSVGIQLGFISETFKGTEIIIPEGDDAHDSNDDAIPNTDVTGTSFDMSAGLWYQHKYFWVGASVTHITAPSVTLKEESNDENYYEFQAGRNYYFMAGGNIPLKNTLFELQPSLMFKSDLNTWQAEVTARVRYNKFISGGVAYRWKDAVSALIGVEYKNFFAGYSYDYPLSEIRRATHGSHELWVSYNIKLDMSEKNKNKQKSIRLM